MSIPTWPEAFPLPLLEGYQLQRAPKFRTAKMVTGRQRKAPLAFRAYDHAQISWVCPGDDLARIDQFWADYCQDGRGWWLMPVSLPQGMGMVECSLYTPEIRDEEIGAGLWQRSAEIEFKWRP